MAEDIRRALSMLTILLATCQTTLHTLQVANNAVDEDLTDLLEKMVERTRLEIETLRVSV
jgi:hypothetical protein